VISLLWEGSRGADMDEPMHEITKLLQAWSNGDTRAIDKLMPLVDRELKKIARNYMRNERAGHILQTTALVNEALIKLIRENISFADRKHFYGIVSKRMRQVLRDYWRKRPKAEHVNVDDMDIPDKAKAREIRLLEEALTELVQIDERKATIVEYRFFIGLSFDETAKVLDISSSTVQREWSFARAWLNRYLSAEPTAQE
jgi:RNA polymerase sigma factor (TIGR02999 family)